MALVADDNASWAGAIAGFLREASVLILVFGLLEPLLTMNQHGLTSCEQATSAALVFGTSLGAFVGAVCIEKKRMSP